MATQEQDRIRQILEDSARGDKVGKRLGFRPDTKRIEVIDQNDPDIYRQITDPMTHFTYRAVQTADGNGYAFEIIKQAQVRGQAFEDAEADLDAATPGSNAWRTAKRTADRAERRLADSLEFIDDIRVLQEVFAF